MWRRALALWLAIIAAESAHGTLREWLLRPALGDLRARQLSVVTGALVILAVATLGSRWLAARRAREQLQVGASWVALTIAFEVALGRLVLGYEWQRITEDYDPRRGGYLALGMLVLALAPWIAARLRRS
ncbi:MAG: hypothetical protein FJ091_15480 [Deltaproteobacteria bacterium]|nr:hypothetical protein [Deltaproteobacteria bacterium]